MIRVTGLFEHPDTAARTMRELEASGFECIRVDEQSTQISPGDEITADELIDLGVASAEAEFYTRALSQGASLLVVTTDRSRLDELTTLLHVAGLVEVPTTEESDRLRYESPHIKLGDGEELIDESGVHRSERVRDEFQRADSERMIGEHDSGDATGLSRRAYGPSSKSQGEDAMSSGPFQPFKPNDQIPDTRATLPEEYERYERAFRDHYEDHFAHTDHDYGEYLRAYRYGVVLAQEQSFRDRSWEDVQNFAAQGWDPQTHGAWEDFRSAVHYGWNLIRGGDARQQSRN